MKKNVMLPLLLLFAAAGSFEAQARTISMDATAVPGVEEFAPPEQPGTCPGQVVILKFPDGPYYISHHKIEATVLIGTHRLTSTETVNDLGNVRNEIINKFSSMYTTGIFWSLLNPCMVVRVEFSTTPWLHLTGGEVVTQNLFGDMYDVVRP
jgi:hypothetical protein